MAAFDLGSPTAAPFLTAAPVNLPEIPNLQRGGMFGNVSIDPSGFLPGFLAGLGAPGGNVALQAYQQRLQDARAAALAEQTRQRNLEDQVAFYDYKRNNPEPGNSAFEVAAGAAGLTPGTPEYKSAASGYLQHLSDPMINVTLPGGGLYSGPQSGLTQALQGYSPAPTKPVGKLTPLGAGGPAPGPGGFL